jgi:hypothetical protein
MVGGLSRGLFTGDRAGWNKAERLADILDFTPVGGLLSMYDAGRQTAQGNYGGGLLALGMAALPGPNVARRNQNALGSRSYLMYNPPSKPQRPFEADYPQGASGDADTGRLLADIEGRPLVAERIVGRRVVGGGDESLPQESLAALVTEATGRDPRTVPAGDRQIRGSAGALVRDLRLNKYDILLNRNVPEGAVSRVLAHEVGHLIDEMSGEIPTEGLSRELDHVYDTLVSGRERTTNLTRPRHLGYTSTQTPRELMAEAIRAYLANPNYLKTVAPRTAAAIRAAVNSHPRLSKIVQFNSLAAAAAGTAMTSGQAGPAPEQKQNY